jgi:hypothetical protein
MIDANGPLRSLPLPGRGETVTPLRPPPIESASINPATSRGQETRSFVAVNFGAAVEFQPKASNTEPKRSSQPRLNGDKLSDEIVGYLLSANEEETSDQSPTALRQRSAAGYGAAAAFFPASQPSLFRLGV